MKNNYTEEFVNSIIQLKIVLILFFIIVTSVYIIRQKTYIQEKNTQVYTLLHSKKYFIKLLLSCLLEAFGGILTFIFIFSIREGTHNIMKNLTEKWKELLMIGGILFLFKFLRESSGLNRWNNEYNYAYEHIIKSESESESKSKAISNINTNLNNQAPFESALGWTTLGLLGSFVGIFILKMLFLSYHGYKDGNFNLIPLQQLLLEICIIGFINVVPSLTEPILFDEQFGTKTLMTAGPIASVAMIFHLMSQGAGLYNGLSLK